MSRTHQRFARTLWLLLGLGFAAPAHAIPIQFIYTGTASGTLDATVFANADFVITQNADTSNVEDCGVGCFTLDASSTLISIEGIGIFDFITGTRSFAFNGFVGLARADGADLYDVFDAGPGYNLQSAVGPIFDDAFLLQWDLMPIVTEGGVLFIENAGGSNPSFTATVATTSVPEPALLTLLGLGMVGIAMSRRRS